MANKYLTLLNGIRTLIEAITSSSGAGDAGKIVALDGSGRLDSTFMPVGIGADTKTIKAAENLSAGNLVNIYLDGSPAVAVVRKADAGNGYEAHGFVLSSASAGANATVYFEGTITGLTSLSIGDRYYLSDTAGEVTDDVSAFSGGDYVQYIGVAVSDTEISFEPDDYTVTA